MPPRKEPDQTTNQQLQNPASFENEDQVYEFESHMVAANYLEAMKLSLRNFEELNNAESNDLLQQIFQLTNELNRLSDDDDQRESLVQKHDELVDKLTLGNWRRVLTAMDKFDDLDETEETDLFLQGLAVLSFAVRSYQQTSSWSFTRHINHWLGSSMKWHRQELSFAALDQRSAAKYQRFLRIAERMQDEGYRDLSDREITAIMHYGLDVNNFALMIDIVRQLEARNAFDGRARDIDYILAYALIIEGYDGDLSLRKLPHLPARARSKAYIDDRVESKIEEMKYIIDMVNIYSLESEVVDQEDLAQDIDMTVDNQTLFRFYITQFAKNTLDEREAKILYLYFEEDQSFNEIGKLYQVTAERTRKIYLAAIMKLRRKAIVQRAVLADYIHIP